MMKTTPTTTITTTMMMMMMTMTMENEHSVWRSYQSQTLKDLRETAKLMTLALQRLVKKRKRKRMVKKGVITIRMKTGEKKTKTKIKKGPIAATKILPAMQMRNSSVKLKLKLRQHIGRGLEWVSLTELLLVLA
jgi:hypothetical protein